jgi:hypothetical protein
MGSSKKMLMVAGCATALCVGCASTAIQHQRVEQVKSVAIVGLAAGLNIENRTQGKGAAELGAAQEISNLGSDEKIAERKEQGNQLYDALVAEIGKTLGWTVKSRAEVVGDAANQALYVEKIGEPNRLQLGGMRIYVPGVLWTERVSGLTPPERQKLLESLGVDALVFADVHFFVGKIGPVTWKAGNDGGFVVTGPIPGTSAAYPAARVRLEVYDSDFPQPIWADSAAGEPAKAGVVSTMGIEYKTDLVPILKDALHSAWAALLQAYEADKAQAATAAAAQ